MNDGDFVEIDYLAKVKNTNSFFDVTNEETAKKVGLYQKNKVFKPIVVIVGARHVIEGLDDALLEMDVGEEKFVEISPEKGFGKRNAKLITTLPLREFSKQGIMPRPGITIEIAGKWATIKNVSSGRVTLDFNHSLAGRFLEYNVKILQKVDDTVEKLYALLELHLQNFERKRNEVSIDEDGKATIKIIGLKKDTEEIVKKVIEEEVEKYIPEIKEIEFSN